MCKTQDDLKGPGISLFPLSGLAGPGQREVDERWKGSKERADGSEEKGKFQGTKVIYKKAQKRDMWDCVLGGLDKETQPLVEWRSPDQMPGAQSICILV